MNVLPLALLPTLDPTLLLLLTCALLALFTLFAYCTSHVDIDGCEDPESPTSSLPPTSDGGLDLDGQGTGLGKEERWFRFHVGPPVRAPTLAERRNRGALRVEVGGGSYGARMMAGKVEVGKKRKRGWGEEG